MCCPPPRAGCSRHGLLRPRAPFVQTQEGRHLLEPTLDLLQRAERPAGIVLPRCKRRPDDAIRNARELRSLEHEVQLHHRGQLPACAPDLLLIQMEDLCSLLWGKAAEKGREVV